MKKLTVILLIGIFLISGCASTKMFKYADEKADKYLAEKTIAEEKVKDLEEFDKLRVIEYDKAIKFIEDTRVGILKANFPIPYLKYMNTLARWNFPIEIAIPDSVTGGKK